MATTKSGSATTYRPELDGLRSIAVYSVILFHTGMQWLSGGFVGVDLFFVLSGFLVTQVILGEIARTGTFGVGAFYSRRVRRLVPAAVVVVVATCLVYGLVDSLPERLTIVRDAQSALVYLANWNFISEASDYFATGTDKSPFLHFWSLSIEEQFYVGYPLLLIGLLKLKVRPARRLLVILVLAAASVAAQVYWAGADPTRAYYGTDAKLYQILAGAALAMWLSEGSPGLRRRLRPGFVGGVGLVSVVVLATSLVPVSTSVRGLLATVASLAVIGGVWQARSSWTSRLLALRIPVYLGKISYGTYLWHWPVLLVTAMFLEVRPLVLFAVAGTLATGLAALSAEILELPVRRLVIASPLRWPVAVSGFAIGLLLAGLVVAPILTSSRAPAVAAGVGGGGPHGSEVWGERAVQLKRPVPQGLDYAAIALDRGPDDTWCQPDSVQDCLVQDGNGPTIVLVGDSHARMIEPAFLAEAEQRGYKLYVDIVSSCPWQAGLINIGADEANQAQCHEARDGFYDKTLPQMHPDLVVLASYARTGAAWEGYLADDEGLDLPLDQLLQRTTQRTVNRIAATGAHTAILHSVMGTDGWSESGWDPLDCLARAKVLGDCAVVPPSNRPIVDSFFDSLAVARDDVTTLDLNPLICPGAPLCSPLINGRVVWRNPNHLTEEIVSLVRVKFWQQLQDSGALDGLR